LRLGSVTAPETEVALTIDPRGLVPELIEATLFPEDDITFADGSRRRVLAAHPVYVASEYAVPVRFGSSWTGTARRESESIRVRVSARALTGELINRDAVCSLRVERLQSRARRVDDDTLLEAYPGVEGSPAVGEVFVGRRDELERLHETLVSARIISAASSFVYAMMLRTSRPKSRARSADADPRMNCRHGLRPMQ
jgi:hypothetical protein